MPTVSYLAPQVFTLAANEVLTVAADSVSTGLVIRLGESAGADGQVATPLSASDNKTFGPFSVPTRFQVVANVGTLTVSTAIASVGFTSGSAFGTGLLRMARAKYDFTVDGGASCTPVTNATI